MIKAFYLILIILVAYFILVNFRPHATGPVFSLNWFISDEE